jgi:hypothetical protein
MLLQLNEADHLVAFLVLILEMPSSSLACLVVNHLLLSCSRVKEKLLVFAHYVTSPMVSMKGS